MDNNESDTNYAHKHSEVREFDRYLDYSMNIELDTIAVIIGFKK